VNRPRITPAHVVGLAAGFALVIVFAALEIPKWIALPAGFFLGMAGVAAKRQMPKVLSNKYRLMYAPWFIAVIGVGMVLIGGYFVVGALVGMSS
jgi:hypothetical protein